MSRRSQAISRVISSLFSRVHHHESLTKFNNHTLNSAERFYKQSSPTKPMRSASAVRLR